MPRSDSPLTQVLLALLHDIPGMVSDRVHLAALELRRARHSLIRMIALMMIAAILVSAALFSLWAAIAMVLVSLGMSAHLVFLLLTLFNGVAGWLAFRRAWSLAEDLTLPATVRQLTIRPIRPLSGADEENAPQSSAVRTTSGWRSS